MIAVPTTASNGSEAQGNAAIADPGARSRVICGDPKMFFRAAILDPKLTLGQSAADTASNGYRAISNAVETLLSTRRTPISECFSREAWRLLDGSFARVVRVPEDLEARSAILLGAHFAGLAVEYAALGPAHACAQPLVENYHLSAGSALGLVLAPALEWIEQGEDLVPRLEELASMAELPPVLTRYASAGASPAAPGGGGCGTVERTLQVPPFRRRRGAGDLSRGVLNATKQAEVWGPVCRCIIKDVSLYERYELLDLNRDDGVKTFEAREIATGRPVKVHLFVRPGAPLQAALLKAIDHLSETDGQRVIERGKHEGTPYVVTDRLADYPGLSEWVQAASHHSKSKAAKPVLETAGAWKVQPVPAPPPPAPQAAPPPPAALPQESALNQQFVELFTTAERPIVADSLAPSAPRPQSAAPVRPPEPVLKQAQTEPGEFTRMFQAPGVVAPAAPPPAPPLPPQAKTEAGEFTKMFQAPKAPAAPPAPAPIPTPTKEPGEFTRMFQASPNPAAAPPQPPAGTKSGPGDFEQLFETRSPAGPMPHSPAVQQPLTPQAPGGSGPNRIGEFTQTFGKGRFDPAPAPPATAPLQKEPGEFTRMFHSPGAAAPPPVAPVAAPPAPPAFAAPPVAATPIAAQPSGPGEYTRQFSAPAQLTFGQTSATPAAPPAPGPQAYAPPAMAQPAMPNMAQAPMPPKKSNLVLILGIVGIVLVIALLVVFFAMRPK